MMRLVPGTLALVFGLALAALAPTTARADHTMYAGFGAGPYFDVDCCAVHGRVQGEIGWHFGGDDTGFLLELDALANFGRDYWMFVGGLRLGGDIEVHRDRHFQLLVRPSGLVGLGARDYNDPPGPYGLFVLQPAFDLRFVVADGLLAFWVRPVAFDILFFWDRNDHPRDVYVSAAYQLMGGLDFQF